MNDSAAQIRGENNLSGTNKVVTMPQPPPPPPIRSPTDNATLNKANMPVKSNDNIASLLKTTTSMAAPTKFTSDTIAALKPKIKAPIPNLPGNADITRSGPFLKPIIAPYKPIVSPNNSSSVPPLRAPSVTPPPPSISHVDMEKHKNEIVQNMLRKLSPYVSATTGKLKDEADFDVFAHDLMDKESNLIQRTLILTVLLNAANSAPLTENPKHTQYWRMAQSDDFLSAIVTWLSECPKMEGGTSILSKLFDLLIRMPLSFDQLVTHKIGKIVKKMLNATTSEKSSTYNTTLSSASVLNDESLRKRAEELCENWTLIAKEEDSRRKQKQMEEEKIKKAYLAAQNEAKAAATVATLPPPPPPPLPSSQVPPLKTRAEVILERAAARAAGLSDNIGVGNTLGNPSGTFSSLEATCRPLSSDDIQRAKKRQQYLQDLTGGGNGNGNGNVGEMEIMNNNNKNELLKSDDKVDVSNKRSSYNIGMITTSSSSDSEENESGGHNEPNRKRPKKRVSFAEGDELIQVRYFESSEDERTMAIPSFIQDDEVGPSTIAHHCNKFIINSFLFINNTNTIFHHHHHHYYLDSNFHELDKNEASFAFRKFSMAMEPEIDWYPPKELSMSETMQEQANLVGSHSEEKQAQEIRERTALSAVYYNEKDIPESPNEQLPLLEASNKLPTTVPTSIPLHDPEGQVTKVGRYIYSPPISPPSLPATMTSGKDNTDSTLNILSSLFNDPIALQNLLKGINTATTVNSTPTNTNIGNASLFTSSTAHSLTHPPVTMPNLVIQPQSGGGAHSIPPHLPPPPPPPPPGIHPVSLQLGRPNIASQSMPMSHTSFGMNSQLSGQFPSGMMFPPPPPGVRPPPSPMSFPGVPFSGMPPPMMPSSVKSFPQSLSPPGMGRPSQPYQQGFIPLSASQQAPSHDHGTKRMRCRHYKKGRPNSCRYGANCQFIHED